MTIEQQKGISPQCSHRTGLEPLSSSGSHLSAAGSIPICQWANSFGSLFEIYLASFQLYCDVFVISCISFVVCTLQTLFSIFPVIFLTPPAFCSTQFHHPHNVPMDCLDNFSPSIYQIHNEEASLPEQGQSLPLMQSLA